jgi:hypothetical protein
MDRKTFLQRFGMGVAGIILTPKIVSANLIKANSPIVTDNIVNWRLDEIFIRVVNNNPVPTEVMLFGINQNIKGNFIPEGIKIFIAGATYQELQSAILYSPVRIQGLRIQARDMMQFANPMELYDVRPSGAMTKMYFDPINYRSARDKFTIIDCPGFELLLTPSIYILNRINANEQVDYVFSITRGSNVNSILRSIA